VGVFWSLCRFFFLRLEKLGRPSLRAGAGYVHGQTYCPVFHGGPLPVCCGSLSIALESTSGCERGGVMVYHHFRGGGEYLEPHALNSVTSVKVLRLGVSFSSHSEVERFRGNVKPAFPCQRGPAIKEKLFGIPHILKFILVELCPFSHKPTDFGGNATRYDI